MDHAGRSANTGAESARRRRGRLHEVGSITCSD
jgi:hypothetical protein